MLDAKGLLQQKFGNKDLFEAFNLVSQSTRCSHPDILSSNLLWG
jgi:hypothetical protein